MLWYCCCCCCCVKCSWRVSVDDRRSLVLLPQSSRSSRPPNPHNHTVLRRVHQSECSLPVSHSPSAHIHATFFLPYVSRILFAFPAPETQGASHHHAARAGAITYTVKGEHAVANLDLYIQYCSHGCARAHFRYVLMSCPYPSPRTTIATITRMTSS